MRQRLPLLVVLVTASCGDPSHTSSEGDPFPGAPTLRITETIRLQEPDTLFLGRPISLSIGAGAKSFYVADAQNNYAVKYDRAGTPVLVYGSSGSGPGEIQLLTGMFSVGDHMVLMDAGSGLFKLFERRAGHYLRSKRFIGSASTFIPSAADTVWFGLKNATLNSVVAMWVPQTDSVIHLGRIPEEYSEHPNLNRFTSLPVVKWADTVLVGFGPLNGLVLLNTEGDVLDTLVIPTRHRRGSAASTVRASSGRLAPLANGISSLDGLHRLSDGTIALVHSDNHVAEGPAPRITATLYLSLLAKDLSAACVDQRVPIEADARPVIQFQGDTLFILHQQVTELESHTSIAAITVGSEGCDWRALEASSRMLWD